MHVPTWMNHTNNADGEKQVTENTDSKILFS